MINYKLKAARVERNLKQEDVAKFLDMSPQSYSLKECGKREFSRQEIQKIIKEFGFTPEQTIEIFFTQQLNTKGKSA